jgi:hypothetical protein
MVFSCPDPACRGWAEVYDEGGIRCGFRTNGVRCERMLASVEVVERAWLLSDEAVERAAQFWWRSADVLSNEDLDSAKYATPEGDRARERIARAALAALLESEVPDGE